MATVFETLEPALVAELECDRVEGSSMVYAIGYHRERQTIYVEFHNHRVYRYLACPPELWSRFRNWDSKGKFVNSHLKGTHIYEEVRTNGNNANPDISIAIRKAGNRRDL